MSPSTASLPSAMRAAVMYDVDDIRIETRALPKLAPGDVLVRTAASGICSGDLMPWYVRRKVPFVFGHEPAGTIVAVNPLPNDDARELLGARVFAHHHAPCLACVFCGRGDFVQCAQWRATALDPGGMAEFFRVPAANRVDMHRLPDAMSFVDGSLVEPLACVVKSLRRGTAEPVLEARDGTVAPILNNRNVYVVGLGVMGLMHVALAAALGARVFGSDFVVARRERGTSLGATTFEPPAALDGVLAQTGGLGADVVICGPASAVALDHSLAAVARGGSVVMFTPFEPGDRYALDHSAMYFRDVRLIPSYSCGPDDTRAALGFLSAGAVSAQALGVETVLLSDVRSAYDAMRVSEVVKSVVVFD